MQKKIALVTGATSGIGLETALALSRQNYKVIIGGRDQTKIQTTIQLIKSAVPNADLDYLLADLCNLSDVKKLADEFSLKYEKLDVLVNNAGSFFIGNKKSVDGFEKTWMTNYLSPVYLTELLLPKIQASAQGRIVNVSSKLHFNGKLDLSNLNGEKSFKAALAYANSKLALVMYTYTLAKRLANTSVTANVLHPGIIATNIWNSIGGPRTIINWFTRLLIRLGYFITPEQGAQTSIFLASSDAVTGISGKYFDKSKETNSKRISHNKDLQKELWEVTKKSLRL